MHGKSRADQWQRYIRDKLDKALSARSAWFLFLLAFVVVYREVFETILFYAALWTRSEEHTSELQSLMRISYAVFCLKKKKIYVSNMLYHQTNNTIIIITYDPITIHEIISIY